MCLLNCVAVISNVKIGTELKFPPCLFKGIARRQHSVPSSKAQGLSVRAGSVSIKGYPDPLLLALWDINLCYIPNVGNTTAKYESDLTKAITFVLSLAQRKKTVIPCPPVLSHRRVSLFKNRDGKQVFTVLTQE